MHPTTARPPRRLAVAGGLPGEPGSECSPGTQASAWAWRGTGRTRAVGAGQLCEG